MKQYEYKVVQFLGVNAVSRASGASGTDILNSLGEFGWELVSVCVQFNMHTAYLKREIEPSRMGD